MGVADAIEAGGYLYDVTILERLTSSEGAEVVNFNAALFNSGAPALITPPGRGRAVLEAVTEAGSDFMVMGAFGESRIEALLGLGRATEKVVTASKIPLL